MRTKWQYARRHRSAGSPRLHPLLACRREQMLGHARWTKLRSCLVAMRCSTDPDENPLHHSLIPICNVNVTRRNRVKPAFVAAYADSRYIACAIAAWVGGVKAEPDSGVDSASGLG